MGATRSVAVFGASDGLVACIGVVLATAARGRSSVLHAALGLLIAEGLGMAASEWLSQETATNWRQAVVMGVATSLPIIAVAAPWVVLAGTAGVCASGAVAVVLAGVIAVQRRRGARGWLETFGVLLGVAALAYLAGL